MNVRLVAQSEGEIDTGTVDQQVRLSESEDSPTDTFAHKVQQPMGLDQVVRVELINVQLASPPITDIHTACVEGGTQFGDEAQLCLKGGVV